MTTCQLRDIVVGRARERGGDVEDSHLRANRVTPTGSQRRQLSDQAQFRAPHTIRRRGPRFAYV